MESAMASKFEPRPESRMPSFLCGVMRLGVSNLAIALDNAADEVTFFTAFFDQRFYSLVFLSRYYQHHPNSHVEGAQHFIRWHIPNALQMAEYGRNRPGAHLHHGSTPPGKHSGKIVSNSASGDVGHGMH